MNNSYTLDYKNVILRPLYDADLEILRKIRNDSSVSRYLRKISYISQEQQRKWFQRVLAEKNTTHLHCVAVYFFIYRVF